jgi:N-acetylglucosaminyldiphosphoundecaprenol N-acetyl-beta-D-mannosaminyltransferase
MSTLIGGMRVDAGNYSSASTRILEWAGRGESRYVCIANVHMLMETRDSAEFRAVVNGADMVTSDGMPLVWMLRWRGRRDAERVYGPDLMLQVCADAARAGVPVGLFGGTEEVLESVCAGLERRFPALRIVARIAPPFGRFTAEQNDAFGRALAASGARIVFVGLGCPKQERWMAAMRDRIPAVVLGVGAAFNFHAGKVRQSPAWLQRAGLEWLFRLAVEPRRLWRRYVWHNPRFIWAMVHEEWCRRRMATFPARGGEA